MEVAKLIAEKDFEGALQLPFPSLNPIEHIQGSCAALERDLFSAAPAAQPVAGDL
ncbi:MAG: hypothetical protein ACLUJG_00955 [Lawsonibacter sp.]